MRDVNSETRYLLLSVELQGRLLTSASTRVISQGRLLTFCGRDILLFAITFLLFGGITPFTTLWKAICLSKVFGQSNLVTDDL